MTPNQTTNNFLIDPLWRLENLYYIIDKHANKIQFKLNWAQKELYKDLWYCNLVLKARQLGISTFVSILFLDRCLFNPNMAAGIIAHTREDAEHLFRKIKFAYDNLPKWLSKQIIANTDSARELSFSNGSSIRVGTSMRGQTLNYLHISEFGKICAKYPDKAEEIITGSLNTIAPGQYIIIESTAEGKAGYFYDMCQEAQKKDRYDLTQMDFRFHFFPWYKEPSYRTGSVVQILPSTEEYFTHLNGKGIVIDPDQRWWYALKQQTQGDNMMREYPSTPQEAWMSAIDGSYYSKNMNIIRLEGRIGHVPYDPAIPVHTAWDLGFNDSTAIVFFQTLGKEIHIIEAIEGSGESLAYWLGEVKRRPYVYGHHIAPHDILAHEYTTGMSRQDSARKMGINFIPAPRVEVIPGIDAVRNTLPRCWFHEKKTGDLIKALDNYSKEWDDKHGTWRSKPLHNQFSHYADAFRYLCTSLDLIQPKLYNDSTLGGLKGAGHIRRVSQF